MFDCIIVGAGPAGGSAAYHLAKRGRSVLVLEKDSFPRYKPCSGGVSPVIAKWFDFDFAPAISCKVDQIRYTWKKGDPIDAEITTEAMWMVQREVFDQFLIQKAQSQGAEFRDNTAVTSIQFQNDHWQVNTANGPVEGRYLIAADGAKGPMAEWLGFKPRKTRLAEVMEVPAEAASTVYFELGLVKNGSLWAFPKANGYSIGAGTFRGNDGADLQSSIQEYAQFIGLGSGQFHSHPIALWDGNQPLHTEHALLVGESASLLDPLSAEGIRPGIFSGIKASEAIDQAIAGDASALARYTTTIHEEWGTDMQWAQRIAGMFYRVPGIGYRVGLKRPTATKRMAQLLVGEIRYADIANKVMKRLSGSLIPGFGR